MSEENRREAELASRHVKAKIFPLKNLKDLVAFLHKEKTFPSVNAPPSVPAFAPYEHDFASIVGQETAKRAMMVAAAGHHNVLLRGSPGAGKTLLARALPSIMPPLTEREMIDTTQIYSVAGLLDESTPIVVHRPFRSPHHSASLVALTGGGNPPKPGEITLAHNGLLFLDEFAEFPRSVIESLRQPLEDRVITVARSGYSATYPADVLMIAAVNPCPCGYKDDPKHPCVCTPQQIIQYQKKLSGPILDRIDIHLIVPPLPLRELTDAKDNAAPSSQMLREVVTRARVRQQERYADLGLQSNSQLSNKTIKTFCQLAGEAEELLNQAIDRLNLSARSYHKVLKVARTIADLNEEDTISKKSLAEALSYRPAPMVGR